jgi:DNA-binding transcriptional ArsR family regulator
LLVRWRTEGEAGLEDRSSAPKHRPTQLAARAIEALRRLRMTAAEIAECLKMALSTVSRWLKRIGAEVGTNAKLRAHLECGGLRSKPGREGDPIRPVQSASTDPICGSENPLGESLRGH